MSEVQFPGRRDFLKIAAGTFVVASVPLAWRARSKLVRRSLPVMGCTAEIAVIHRDERYAYHAMDAALSEIQRIDRAMSRFNVASDIGRANLMAGAGPIRIAPETARVVQHALDWAEATDGGFDPGVARIVDLWDVGSRKTPPPAPQVRRLAGRKFYRHIDVDPRAGMVRFSERDVAIDLGGIAAGYAVDRAVAVLRAWNIRDGFINVSGDIYALGHSEDGDDWKVGVRSPSDPAALIKTVRLSDAAIATSGDYEQFFEYQGRRYHHIMDTATAAPRLSNAHSITIQADTCLTCDVASTTFFGLAGTDAMRALSLRDPSARVVA